MKPVAVLYPLFLFGCNDNGVTAFNAAPEVVFTSHGEGDSVYEGEATTVSASVSDPDDARTDLSVSIEIDGEAVCSDLMPEANGVVYCTHVFEAGGGDVSALATDPGGAVGTANLTLSVVETDAPVATISSPTTDERYYSDDLITFSATVSDAETDAAELIAVWESSLQGVLKGVADTPDDQGELLDATYLDEGDHFLTLTVTDGSGKSVQDSVTIEVGAPNSAPQCEIVSPANGDSGTEGQQVVLQGTGTDVDVDSSMLSYVWESDKDGELTSGYFDSDGSTSIIVSTLSVASHTISLTVEDEQGESCRDSAVYSVGSPPSLSLWSPTTGDVYNEGENVSFAATISDGEDLAEDLTVSWESDLDGEFNTDPSDSGGMLSFADDSLQYGEHEITITVSDSSGLYASDTASITVNGLPTEPTLSLTPDPATTEDDLTANASGSTDPEGDTLSYSYAWYENGVLSSASTSSVFPSDSTQKNYTYEAVVTPNDGISDGPSASAILTVSNSDPEVTGLVVDPSATTIGNTLTCVETSSDPDGEALTSAYSWSVGGVEFATGPSVALSNTDVAPSDTVTCTVTVTDSDGASDTGSATASVSNSDPVINTVTISVSDETGGSSSDVLVTSILGCSATGSDPDGTETTLSYAWTNDTTGASLGTGGSVTLDSSTVSSSDTVTCTATITDVDGGTGTGSASVVVDNTSPTVEAVTITPSSGVLSDEDLSCVASASDEDGATPTLSYAWTNVTTGAALATADSVTLSASSASPGDTIRCTATATDSAGATAADSAEVEVENSAPTVDSVDISPASGVTTTTALSCSASTSDTDGTTAALAYEWTNITTGASLGSGASIALTTSTSSPGDEIRCTATATDIEGDSAEDSATVSVENTDPVVSAVEISPSSNVATLTTVTCSATGADADGDSVSFGYTWTNASDGTTLGEASVLSLDPSNVQPGDTVTCTATADDGREGTGTGSASVTVENSDPTISSVSISPTTGIGTSSTLTCAVTATDPDGSLTTESYAWSNSTTGSTLGSGSSIALDKSAVSPGDVVTCTATVEDPDGGSDVGTSSVAIGNASPTVDSVSISPATGVMVMDTLSCSATASDEDGETVSLTYEWTNATNGSSLGTGDELMLSSAISSPGDEIRCTATATDPSGASGSDNASVTVENTAPEVTDVTLDPTSPTTSDVVFAYPTTTDADGDTVSVTYEWFVNEVSVRSGTTDQRLGTSYFEKNDVLRAEVTPSDGTESGDAFSSSSITVVNTAPGAPVVAIDPDEPSAGLDDLICYVDTEASDDDDDALNYTVSWSVNGTDYSALSGATGPFTTDLTDDTVPGDDTVAGDVWTCTVVADDGEDSGSEGTASVEVLEGCDVDEDGYENAECGGDDCDDEDSSIYPYAGDFYGDGVDSDCDGVDCEAGEYSGNYYAMCDDASTWSDAEGICLDRGYDGLATIPDSGVQAFLADLIDDMGTLYTLSPWLGLNDQAIEGVWVWSDGSAFSYSNWDSGEPNGSTSEACGHFNWRRGTYAWNDAPCSGFGGGGLICQTY